MAPSSLTLPLVQYLVTATRRDCTVVTHTPCDEGAPGLCRVQGVTPRARGSPSFGGGAITAPLPFLASSTESEPGEEREGAPAKHGGVILFLLRHSRLSGKLGGHMSFLFFVISYHVPPPANLTMCGWILL